MHNKCPDLQHSGSLIGHNVSHDIRCTVKSTDRAYGGTVDFRAGTVTGTKQLKFKTKFKTKEIIFYS